MGSTTHKLERILSFVQIFCFLKASISSRCNVLIVWSTQWNPFIHNKSVAFPLRECVPLVSYFVKIITGCGGGSVELLLRRAAAQRILFKDTVISELATVQSTKWKEQKREGSSVTTQPTRKFRGIKRKGLIKWTEGRKL